MYIYLIYIYLIYLIYICIYIYTHTYIDTYIYTHTHTHTHTCTSTHTSTRKAVEIFFAIRKFNYRSFKSKVNNPQSYILNSRDSLNPKLCILSFTEALNRDFKILLIKYLWQDVCFMYPDGRIKLQMFF